RPTDPITGTQPKLFVLAVQYVEIAPVQVLSSRNTSRTAFVSLSTRFVALLSNTTNVPSADIAGALLVELPSNPNELMLQREVAPACKSRTNTSSAPLVSPGTRLEAWLLNATRRPSAESARRPLPMSPL